MLLPRLIDVSSLGDIEFEAWLSGVAAALPLRHRDPPLDSRRPPGFVEQARRACRKALGSPVFAAIDLKLREFDPSRSLRKTWLRELWSQGGFSAAAKVAMTAARDRVPAEPFGPERVILLQSALESLDRLTDARLDLSTQALVCRQFEFFADPGKDCIPRFDPAESFYRAFAGMSFLERIPSGPLDWEIATFPRSLILKTPGRHVPRVFHFLATGLWGVKPAIFTRQALLPTPSPALREEDVLASYLRIARCMALRPELIAIVSKSWLYCAETHCADPHFSASTGLLEENGGVIPDLGKCPEDAGFLSGPRLRTLYEAGEYKPTRGVILWPRWAVLEWLSKQPDGADLQE